MNQCPFCKNELFSDEITRCPSCGKQIVNVNDSDDGSFDTSETFTSDEFPAEESGEDVSGNLETLDLQSAEDSDSLDLNVESSNDSADGSETYIEDELAEHLADPSEKTVAFDERTHGPQDHTHATPDVEATIPELEEQDSAATLNMSEDSQAPDNHESADATIQLESGSGGDVEGTYVDDSDDGQTLATEDLADQTMILEDGDSFEEAIASDEDGGADSTQILNAEADELKTLQVNWSAQPKDAPEMTIKGRLDHGGSSSGSTDSFSAVPERSMRSMDGQSSSLDLPEYELLSVLGEGGMGVVWSARQTSVDRNVAVKMIKGAYSKKKGQRNKFLAEAIVTGDLDHPNIVPIYDVGADTSGSLFYAMKQVQGTPWLKVIKQKTLHENLDILLRVADAVGFAHARGIVHRDLKPENVMLGEFGEVLVMDWGLALPLDNFNKSRKIRQFSSMGGTPAYMSPEMATGPIDRITPQSDIYLLGAILWEVITRKPPHPGKKVQECLLAAMRNTIRATQEKGELVEIALKAMATNVADRHADVREFQNEIRAYLDHSESLALAAHARKDLQQAQLSGDYNDYSKSVFGFEQARDLWVGNSDAEAGVYEAKLAYAKNAHQKEDYDLALSLLTHDREEHQSLRTEILRDQRERDAHRGRLKFAKRAITAMAVCFLAVVSVGFVVIRAERNEALKQKGIAVIQQQEAEKQKVIAEDEREEADNQRLIAEEQKGIAEQKKSEAEKANMDLQVALVDVNTQKTIAENKTKIAEKQEAEAKKQAMIASMKEKEANEQRVLAEKSEEEAKRQTMIAAANEKKAQQQERLAKAQKLEADKQRIKAVAQEKIADQERLIAVAAKEAEEYEAYIARIGLAAAKIDENSFDVAIELLKQCPEERRHWEWGRLMHLCKQSSEKLKTDGPVDAVAVSPDGKLLLTGSWDNKTRIWDLETKQIIRELPQDGLYVHSAAWSPNQKIIATGGSDASGRIQLWDAESGRLLSKFNGHTDAVVNVRFSPTGEWLLTCSYDETARIWDLTDPQNPTEIQVLEGHSWWVWDGAFSPDFDPRSADHLNQIVTVSQDGKAIIWKVADGIVKSPLAEVSFIQEKTRIERVSFEMVQESIFTGHRGPIYSVAFSPNRHEVATSSYDKRVLLWNPSEVPSFSLDRLLVNKKAEVNYRELTGHSSPVLDVTYSKDGQLIVSGGRDNAVKIWSTKTLKPIKTFRGHFSGVRAVDISPDGRQVISGAQDNQVIVWHIDQYEEIRVLNGRELFGHEDAVLGAKFSSDGKQILTAGRDRTARLWNAKTGVSLRTFQEGHDFLTSTGMFLPGGRILATAAADNSVRLWNVESGTQLLRIPGTGRAAVITASSDGHWLVTGHRPGINSEDEQAPSRTHSNERSGVFAWRIKDLIAAAEAGVQSVDFVEKVKPLELNGHYSRVTAVAFAPHGHRLLTCDSRGRSVLWDLDSEKKLWTNRHHQSRITDCLFSPSGDEIFLSSTDHTVSQVDAATGKEDVAGIFKHPTSVTSMALTKDGKKLLTVSILESDLLNPGSTVTLWQTQTHEKLRTFESKVFAVNDISFTPTGDHAIVVTTDNAVRTIDFQANQSEKAFGKPILDFQKLGGLVWAAQFTDDGKSILTVGGSEATIWDAVTLREEISLSPHGAVAAADFSPDGKFVVTGSWDNSAKIWDAKTGQATVKLQNGHSGYVNSVAVSPDSQMVLTGSDDTTAKLWNAKTGEVIRAFRGHTGRVREAIFSPDGTKVLTVSNDRTARLWETDTGHQIGKSFVGHEWAVLCCTFSPDGLRIATGSEDNQARLWSLETHETIAICDGHTAAISAVCFTEDGQRFFTASQDNSAKLWDTSHGREGTEIMTLTEQEQELTAISISPDGRQVVTGSRDGTAVIWLTTNWEADQVKEQK